MIEKLLHWITDRLPCRFINDGERPYLERYYIGTLFGWRFYLHRFVGSDPDRGLHDHPWSRAFSIVLAGWYWEQTRSGTRKVRWFNSLTGDTFHRVVLPCSLGDHPADAVCNSLPGTPQPCWTLFFHRAGDVKPWGFLRKREMIGLTLLPEGTAIYQPYTYQREGSQKDWWLTAPLGREARAQC